jgi:hypothetical protein
LVKLNAVKLMDKRVIFQPVLVRPHHIRSLHSVLLSPGADVRQPGAAKDLAVAMLLSRAAEEPQRDAAPCWTL